MTQCIAKCHCLHLCGFSPLFLSFVGILYWPYFDSPGAYYTSENGEACRVPVGAKNLQKEEKDCDTLHVRSQTNNGFTLGSANERGKIGSWCEGGCGRISNRHIPLKPQLRVCFTEQRHQIGHKHALSIPAHLSLSLFIRLSLTKTKTKTKVK